MVSCIKCKRSVRKVGILRTCCKCHKTYHNVCYVIKAVRGNRNSLSFICQDCKELSLAYKKSGDQAVNNSELHKSKMESPVSTPTTALKLSNSPDEEIPEMSFVIIRHEA